MNQKNNVSFSYRSYNSIQDTDLSVHVDGDDADDVKLAKLLSAFLSAIESRITLNL